MAIDKQNPIQRMLAFVETCGEPKKLRIISQNATLKGELALAHAARLRLFAILPAEQPGTLEHAVWQSIHALEETLSEERGKTIRLSRTRQKIGRQGEAACVADLILGPSSDGFRMLAERGMLQLSFEAVALQFPDRFGGKDLAAARARLVEAGYSSE